MLHTLRNNFFFVIPGMVYQIIMRGPWMYYSHEHWTEESINATDSGDQLFDTILKSNRVCLLLCDGNDLFPSSAPSAYEFMFDLFLCLVVFDSAYHFWHRFHHLSRPLYRYIHRIHHEYHAPFVWVRNMNMFWSFLR